jgi:heat-inducible transcriptional repressor
MADLEDLGLLYAPHTSAGRIPTEAGLSLFVRGLLEYTDFDNFKDDNVAKTLESNAEDGTAAVLEKATTLLSEISKYAGIVFAPKGNNFLKRLEFVALNSNQILVILISNSGEVENRIITFDKDINQGQLESLSNYLTEFISGKTLGDGISAVQAELEKQKSHFSELATQIIQKSLEALSKDEKNFKLILKGQANLLDYVGQIEELEKIRNLFDAIETKETMITLLEQTSTAHGIQVFVGSENKYFDISGCSMIASPYKSSDNKIIGAIGVIGPTNMEYRRIIPLVNYTSKIISQVL